MAYSPLDTARPVVTGTRTAEIDKTRRNIVALRNMIAAIGMAPGFDYSIASGHCTMLMHPKVNEMAIAKVDKYWVQHFGKQMPVKK